MNKRLWHTFRLCLIRTTLKRTEYLRKHKVFGHIGEKSIIRDRLVPLYPERIFIGNNVRFASHVLLVTHDVVHAMLNNIPGQDYEYKEKIGDIRIGDNVFIGSNTTILYDVTIGSNVVIAAGSVVNKDIPSNSVVAGVPARVIGTFEDLIEKRKNI